MILSHTIHAVMKVYRKNELGAALAEQCSETLCLVTMEKDIL